MVVFSGNTDAAPLIGSNVVRDRASDGSAWSEKGLNQTQTASGPRRTV